MGNPLELDGFWLDRIARSVNGLEYGAVNIIVHDGRIVQIERTEKSRFDGEAKPSSARQTADVKRPSGQVSGR